MKYFHRTSIAPDRVIELASSVFGATMQPTDEGPRRRGFTSPVGTLTVSVVAEGGHYTLVTVETNQPGESELDKRAKWFLGRVHTLAEPGHVLRGAY